MTVFISSVNAVSHAGVSWSK